MSETNPTRGDIMLMGRMAAGVACIGRSGPKSIEVAYDDDGFVMPVIWRAHGIWKGQRVYSTEFPYPAQAVEDLLGRVLNGGLCKKCNQTTVIGITIPGYCCFTLHADDVDDDQSYRYVRSCEVKDD